MNRRIMALFSLCLAGCGCAARAQHSSTAPADDSATLHVSANLVLANVVAFGPGGAPDLTLTREDFALFDDGRPVPIKTFDAGDAARPLAIWFLVQCAMPDWAEQGSTLFRGHTNAFAQVLANDAGRDTYGVAHWCDDGAAKLDAEQSPNAAIALRALDAVLNEPVAEPQHSRNGELALQHALEKIVASTRAQDAQRVPAVVFLYGDYSAMPKAEADQIVQAVLSSSATVYGLRDSRSPHIVSLQWLGGEKGAIAAYIAAQTGGTYLTVDAAEYGDGLRRLLAEAHARYELGFAPAALDGKRHRIRVELSPAARRSHPGVRLRFRTGYGTARPPR